MFEKEAEEAIMKKYPSSVQGYKSLIKNWQDGAEFGYNKVKKELEEEKKLNAEIKARFVKCNTCTDDMKSKCLMFTENLCEGERCEELIDIVSLVNKSDLERKIEALEKANEWHYVKDGDLPKDNVRVLSEKGELVFYKGDCFRWFEYSPNADNIKLRKWEEPIAWKEIPELPKESE